MLSISIEKQRKRPPFSNLVWRTDGRGAGGRRDQTCQTEIYYRIVYFYCCKCFRLVLKSTGNARLFSNLVWQRKCSHFFEIMFGGRICGCYMLTISIEKQRKCSPFVFLITLGGRMGGLGQARFPMRVPMLLFCWGRRGILLLF